MALVSFTITGAIYVLVFILVSAEVLDLVRESRVDAIVKWIDERWRL